MNLADELRDYLETSGESMRALSLRAGLNPKAVSDILNIPGLRPRHVTLVALSEVTGWDLMSSAPSAGKTYADLIQRALEAGNGGLASKLRWLCRNAGWAPELKPVCKQDVIDFLDTRNPASFSMTKGSYATYRSALVKAAAGGQPRKRGRRIDDIGGLYRELHESIKASGLPKSAMLASGSFLLFLHDQEIDPADITTDTLAAYYNHRVETSAKSAKSCEKHVREIATLINRLTREPGFDRFGFVPVVHPFADARDKFRVSADDLAPLITEFDSRVAPWAQGEMSRDGLTRAEFIKTLDAAEEAQPACEKIAKLRARRSMRKRVSGNSTPTSPTVADQMRRQGFLVGKQTWNDRTLAARRGYVIAAAKAVIAVDEVVLESMAQLTHPLALATVAETLAGGNDQTYSSNYVFSLLKAMRKIALDYVLRTPDEIVQIDDLIAYYDHSSKGIAARNQAKLRQFNDARIQQTINLSNAILRDVNAKIETRRKTYRKEQGVLPKSTEVVDPEMARDIMAALAHDILLTRAPRSQNVIHTRLDWISWQDGRARITVPAVAVKMRGKGDADLTILLGEAASKLLRIYLETVRRKTLRPGDEQNPYLFPSQDLRDRGPGRPYATVLKRVTRLLKQHIGVAIHPHLYRHLIGWIWLKESIDNLPKVQKLLGHKVLQTTIDHYAELDECLVMQNWQDHLNREPTA